MRGRDNLCYTGNIIERFRSTGMVDIYGADYAGNAVSLQNGDILVSSSHAGVVVSGGKEPGGVPARSSSGTSATSASADVNELACAVIAGRYGNGDARKVTLGDKYAAVQARVKAASLKESRRLDGMRNVTATASLCAR